MAVDFPEKLTEAELKKLIEDCALNAFKTLPLKFPHALTESEFETLLRRRMTAALSSMDSPITPAKVAQTIDGLFEEFIEQGIIRTPRFSHLKITPTPDRGLTITVVGETAELLTRARSRLRDKHEE
jgi:hypothetical protein